jgi:transcriptional regulator with XRE-family HTH domain
MNTAQSPRSPLPDRLRRKRRALDLTQAEAAALAGTHQVTVANIERGARRSPAIERRLARALKVRIYHGDLIAHKDWVKS